MFIGHYGVALAAKKLAPKTSLGVLFLAAQFVDMLWPVFLLAGVEHVRIDPGNTAFTPLDFYDYPITHSLLTGIGWAIVLGLIYWAASRYTKGAWVAGGLVVSHWVLDAVTHRPDLPLVPGTDIYVGLGLWNFVGVSMTLEAAVFGLGLALYLRSTTARDRIGRFGLASLAGLLGILWLANAFGPLPPNVTAVAVSALALWLFVPWANWVDRHRESGRSPFS